MTVDPGVASSILAQSHTFEEIDQEIQERLLSVTSQSICTTNWLTAGSSLSRKKVWLGEMTVPP